MLSRQETIAQLAQYGHKKEQLEKMQTAELQHLFKQDSKKRILQYMQDLQENHEMDIPLEDTSDYIEKELSIVYRAISGDEIDFINLYEVVENIFETYGLNETIELVLSQASDKRYKQMTQVVELAFRAYQETLLDKIEELCENYPAQERFAQLKFYSDKRGDVVFLKESIKEMQKEQNKTLSRIAQQKYEIIHDFYPDLMYESYEEFYENDAEKEAIINNILSLTNAYKRNALKEKKFQILKHMERVLMADKEREKEERALIKQHTKTINEAILSEDEFAFGEALKDALKVLEERDVQYIVEHFDITSNPLMLQKYNVIMRENRRT
ncbi:MAG: hypothetical protein PUB96_07650 [Helicobacteraceae bacterium]|nr:hypothetical protein [Helicobacteraceae bacterium]